MIAEVLGLNPYWEAVLIVAGINAIAATGLYFTMLSGQLSAGHAVFPGIAAYMAGVMSVNLGASIPVAWAAGSLAAFGVGAFLAFAFLPLKEWFLAIALFGVNIAGVSIAESSEYLGSAQGFKGYELLTDLDMVWIILLTFAGILFLFTNSPFERTFRCVRDDPLAAEALGISPAIVRVVTLAVGAFISSFAGLLLAHWLTLVLPSTFGFTESLDYIVFVAIGGREAFLGPIIGSLFLTIASEELRFSAQMRLILYGALLTAVVMFLPGGFIGRWSAGTNVAQALFMMFQPAIELVVSPFKYARRMVRHATNAYENRRAAKNTGKIAPEETARRR